MRIAVVLMLCIVSVEVWGSYRVHQLKVTYAKTKVNKVRSETVLSILDHVQYQNYHGGYKIQSIQLLDHWYCPGDTSRHQFCKKPKVKQGILVEDPTKRATIK